MRLDMIGAKQPTGRPSQPPRRLEAGEADSLDTGTSGIGNRAASTASLTSLTAESGLILHAGSHINSTTGDDGNGTEDEASKHAGTKGDSPALDTAADADSKHDRRGGNSSGDVLIHERLRFGSSFR